VEDDGTLSDWITTPNCINTVKHVIEITGDAVSIPIGK